MAHGLSFDPWPGNGTHAAAGVHRHQRGSRAYTPDVIAVPLVQGAIEFLTTCSIDILRARESYAALMSQVRAPGLRDKARYRKAARRLRTRPILTPIGEYKFRTLSEFYELVDMLYAACFIVIAYLVGARASEILHLESGCIQPLGGDNTAVAVLSGTIFKLEAGYHGRPHQWMAPEPAAHAVTVLEALSAPHRLRTGRPELWLRARNGFRGVTEWESACTEPIWIPVLPGLIGQWLGVLRPALPAAAREPPLAALDSSGSQDICSVRCAQRSNIAIRSCTSRGHQHRAVTDAGYVGTDYSLQHEIEHEVLEQSVAAWEHMLSVTHSSAAVLGRNRGRSDRGFAVV